MWVVSSRGKKSIVGQYERVVGSIDVYCPKHSKMSWLLQAVIDSNGLTMTFLVTTT